MTEDEAKTKWCPMMSRGHIANRSSVGGVREDLSCIGSQCMAWRTTFNYGSIVTIDDKMYQELHQTTPTGYCGLAGKP